jgi:hypothetical protein
MALGNASGTQLVNRSGSSRRSHCRDYRAPDLPSCSTHLPYARCVPAPRLPASRAAAPATTPNCGLSRDRACRTSSCDRCARSQRSSPLNDASGFRRSGFFGGMISTPCGLRSNVLRSSHRHCFSLLAQPEMQKRRARPLLFSSLVCGRFLTVTSRHFPAWGLRTVGRRAGHSVLPENEARSGAISGLVLLRLVHYRRAACSAWPAVLSRSKGPGAMLPKSPRKAFSAIRSVSI